MSLMCPATTADDVDRHLALLDEGTAELVAA
jgi:hypothetical protein